jgi:hypothetical protein
VGPSALIGLDTLEASNARISTSASFGYALRPVTLVARSPDPEGRAVRVVEHRSDASVLFAYAASQRARLGLAFGVVRHSGGGLDAVVSQRSEELAEYALRDPRLSARYHAIRTSFGDTSLSVAARYELTLPLGGAFAGTRSVVAAPGVGAAIHIGRFVAALDATFRASSPVKVATARLGSELALATGVAYRALDWLSLGLEAWAWPSLVAQRTALPNGARIEHATLLPAEWLASSTLHVAEGISASVGAGSALPLSSVRVRTASGEIVEERFAALGTPAFRAVLRLNVTPGQ